jgi:hypothetical protein
VAIATAKQINEGSAAVGAYLLDFKYDEYEIAYHSSIGNWQRTFGYNDMYDEIFSIGSEMIRIKFDFTYDREYVLWGWKGDYWNLQSGAELGLYVYDTEYSGTAHYDAVDFELPMSAEKPGELVKRG